MIISDEDMLDAKVRVITAAKKPELAEVSAPVPEPIDIKALTDAIAKAVGPPQITVTPTVVNSAPTQWSIEVTERDSDRRIRKMIITAVKE
jgi:hypothetical protein